MIHAKDDISLEKLMKKLLSGNEAVARGAWEAGADCNEACGCKCSRRFSIFRCDDGPPEQSRHWSDSPNATSAPG